jgi:hypothetical protein
MAGSIFRIATRRIGVIKGDRELLRRVINSKRLCNWFG